jgi:DNA-binding IclR family transcriptional regulator
MTTTTTRQRTRYCDGCYRLRAVCGHSSDRSEIDATTTAMAQAIKDTARRHVNELTDLPDLGALTRLVAQMAASDAALDRAADAIDIKAITARIRDEFGRVAVLLGFPNPVEAQCQELIDRLTW